jgi:hypothetical protein
LPALGLRRDAEPVALISHSTSRIDSASNLAMPGIRCPLHDRGPAIASRTIRA